MKIGWRGVVGILLSAGFLYFAFRGIEFDDLSFTYPGQAAPALQGVSFRLEPGKSIAVVVPSGAGKSTLASLLLRFWEFSSGEIRVDGRSLHDLAQDEVRAAIGMISPSAHFFDTSV